MYNHTIAIIGLGYVVLPLVSVFSNKNNVIGFDINAKRIQELNNGMGEYIAEKTIKCMISADKKMKNEKVSVLGVTFKENCPVMRNTKVVDIIEELKSYECIVDIFDPWVDPNENKKHYKHGIITDPFANNKCYDAIILAVAHDQFKKLQEENFHTISTGTPVIIDVKGIVPNATWRL